MGGTGGRSERDSVATVATSENLRNDTNTANGTAAVPARAAGRPRGAADREQPALGDLRQHRPARGAPGPGALAVRQLGQGRPPFAEPLGHDHPGLARPSFPDRWRDPAAVPPRRPGLGRTGPERGARDAGGGLPVPGPRGARTALPAGCAPEVRPLYADPVARLAELRAFLPRYWQAALAPHAATARAATEEDVLRRSRTLATQGPEALLDAVGGIAVPGGVAVPGVMAVSGVSRLVLVPLLFGRGTPFFTSAPDGSEAALSYPVEGSAVLVGEAPPARRTDAPARGDRLEILIGRSRAGVVRALVTPTTTSDLATALGLAPSTVSQHLAALLAAGVVRRRRAGVRVLYELDRPGVVLLRHLDHARGAPAVR
ncbi:putative transcriptional regulator [Streptomyces venezuelae]|nr:putative transcriptional regulator [Streptomyces venezuelae]